MSGTKTIIWVMVSVAILLFAFRVAIRLYVFRRLLIDDVAVGIALVLLISVAVMYKYAIPIIFELDRIAKGKEALAPAFLPRASLFLKLQFAIIVLFWTTLWTVKISFLLFYRSLFSGLPDHMLGWWIVCGFALIGYLLCWGFQLGSCVPISHYFVLGIEPNGSLECQLTSLGSCETPRDIHYSNANLYVATGFDISSDLASMLIKS